MFRFWIFMAPNHVSFTKAFDWPDFNRSLKGIPLGETPQGEPEFIIYET